MMKFRKGDSVEALRREHDSWGTLFPGTIISINGNDYVIRYEFLMDQEGEPVLEKVHGKDVRPQPLHQPGKKWRVGDIAEVFDAHCWRVGKVAKALQKNWFVIQLFGSIQLKEFHKSKLRIRQAWHNNKWAVTRDQQFTQKNYSDLFSGAHLQEMGKNSHSREKDKQECCEDEQNHSKAYCLRRNVKRSHAYHGEIKSKNLAIGGNHKKRKLSPFAGVCGRPLLGTLKQVRNISSSKVGDNEKFTEDSTQMDTKMVKATSEWLHISSTPHRRNEDSNQCSVASCSSNHFADALGHNFHEPLENLSNDSDAESSFPTLASKKHIFPFPKHKLDVDIHELEIRAYKSTVQALYASGPLSWEQESLLTNLRLSLNISDEEHLFQLRHLLSTQVM
ncbi:hypothetical protein ACOSP7_001439 [Xanthoceras sorbifolium]|uniref:ENT domain-containing protein n=1 Tax=Xanthoceras sorbifolium TaxID=99658 RepID=A0ABQ8IME8_9ROSI|nr:hypothetical protein JRO89_XS01G0273400 [Xanthoceras sorbifolium]